MKLALRSALALIALPWAATWIPATQARAQSAPTLSVQLSNGAARVTLTAQTNTACTIQYRTGLSPTNHWRFLTNLTPLASSPFRVSDPGPVTGPRFYRA